MTYRQIINAYKEARDDEYSYNNYEVDWMVKHTDFEKGTLCGRQLYKKTYGKHKHFDFVDACDVFLLTDKGNPSGVINFNNEDERMIRHMNYAVSVCKVAKEV